MAELTTKAYFLPMAAGEVAKEGARRVILVVFDGIQTLDAAGPAEVFGTAARDRGDGCYEVILASTKGESIRTTCGFVLATTKLDSLRLQKTDTVLVSGGEEAGIRAAVGDNALIRWVKRVSEAKVVHRLGSVCSGAFVLARAGVLDGHRVATHWSSCALLAKFRPALTVDHDAIFVREGNLWTSAGVTTGIDMALAMVEEDFGRALADRVATRLVVYARRPGFQSQFTDALLAQRENGDPFAAILARARGHLQKLDVPRLAKLAGVSERTLHRRSIEQFGITPAKLVTRLRVEHARMLLSSTSRPLKSIASESGFGTNERMRHAFERELGVRPREVRLLFGRAAAA